MQELENMFQEMMKLLFEEFHISVWGDDEGQCVQLWHTKCGHYIWDSYDEVPLSEVVNFAHKHMYHDCVSRSRK